MESRDTTTQPNAPNGEPAPIEFIGREGEHGLAREMLCSLPRSISCRLCKGEQDCPFVAERPLGRLIVKKREPRTVLEDHVARNETGTRNRPGFTSPVWQRLLAGLVWLSIPFAVWFNWFFHPLHWRAVVVPAAVMLATFAMTVIGVPLVRLLWRDRGGRRRGGAWKPS